MRITFLGTGTSHGVPMIGCDCGTCRSDDPRDRRLRPSVLLTLDDGFAILVDTTPDLRAQALAHDVRRVDAILYTHSHADHIFGLDEVRRYNVLQGGAVPCFGDERTVADLRRTFSYAFDPDVPPGGGVPEVRTFTIAGPFCLGGRVVTPVPLLHGTRPILGYRIGGLAYLTDCNRIPEVSWPLLEDLDLLVLDALRERPHPAHFTLNDAVAVSRRLGARRTCFTHMCHDLRHAETCARLPGGLELAYDGQVIDLPTGTADDGRIAVPEPVSGPSEESVAPLPRARRAGHRSLPG